GDLLGRIRRPAGAVAGRQAARVDVEPIRRLRGSVVPGELESREGARGDRTSGGTAAKIVAMKLPCNICKPRRHEEARRSRTNGSCKIASWAFVSFVTSWFVGGQISNAVGHAVAQETASRTRAHVETLASERFEGRLAGSAGERLAGD